MLVYILCLLGLGRLCGGGQHRQRPEGPTLDETAVPLRGSGDYPLPVRIRNGDVPVEIIFRRKNKRPGDYPQVSCATYFSARRTP